MLPWAAIVVLCSLMCCEEAAAYYKLSAISYNPGNLLLTASTGTYKDLSDQPVGIYYYSGCECNLYFEDYSVVTGYLNSPDGLAYAESRDSLGNAVIAGTFRPLVIGNWWVDGYHSHETDYYYGSQYVGTVATSLGTSTSPTYAFVSCVVPLGETTTSDGWGDAQDRTVHIFRQSVAPSTNVYLTYRGIEEVAYSPHTDNCHFPNSELDPITLGGMLGTVLKPDDNWYHDIVGWTEEAVEYYREERPLRGLQVACDGIFRQEMIFKCSSGAQYPYARNDMRIAMTATTVSSERRGVARTLNFPADPAPAGGDALQPGDAMLPGQYRDSSNGQYRFIYQGDGNLVLYGPGGSVEWAAYPVAHVAGNTVMQGDGNLVIYNSTGSAVWSSGTAGNNGARLYVQNDGRAVIYNQGGSAIWSRP